MKKILLATTILGMSAGYAAADIKFSATASAGIASDGNVIASNGSNASDGTSNGHNSAHYTNSNYHTYSNLDLVVTASGATDGGLTFGVTDDASAGQNYTLSDSDGFDTNGGGFGTPNVWIQGSFGKLEFSTNNFAYYNGDAFNSGKGDVRYTNTFGAVSVGLVANVDPNQPTAVAGVVSQAKGVEVSAMIGYTAGNLSLGADYNQQPSTTAAGVATGKVGMWDAHLTYTMGAIAVTASASNDFFDNGTGESLKLAYTAASGMNAWATYHTNTDGTGSSIDVGGGYTANGLSVTVEADNAGSNKSVHLNGPTNAVHWTATGSYDLGGGLSVVAGTNYSKDMMIGAKMTF